MGEKRLKAVFKAIMLLMVLSLQIIFIEAIDAEEGLNRFCQNQ